MRRKSISHLHAGGVAPRFTVIGLGLILVLSATLAAGCTSADTTSTTATTAATATTATTVTPPTTEKAAAAGDVQLAMSNLTRLVPAVSQLDLQSAASSVQQFGLDLYQVLAKQAGTANLVFSPASIVTALAMTYAGARGTTADEMAKTLHFALQGDTLHQAFNSLDETLQSRNFSEKDPDGKDVGVQIKTANSLWGQKDLTFEKLFLDTLAKNYGAGMRLVDYKTAAEQARTAINAWVSEQTNKKIPELIPQGALDDLTRLVLVNAIYLDATWMDQFDPGNTSDAAFTTLAGTTVTARMMSQTAGYSYGTGDGWQAVELPYLGGKLAVLLIVPDAGKFAQVEQTLLSGTRSDTLIDQAVASLGSGHEVVLKLPKFKFRTQAGLADALKTLGMKTAFDATQADFSGMTTQEPLHIDDVIHEAYVAVDEEGTEAAAATAVIMRAGAAMPQQLIDLTIDRPFIFALRDLDTGELLFLGRVTDPTA